LYQTTASFASNDSLTCVKRQPRLPQTPSPFDANGKNTPFSWLENDANDANPETVIGCSFYTLRREKERGCILQNRTLTNKKKI
jgi:hypothetical protein